MKENENSSIFIEDHSDINITVLDRLLLFLPKDSYIELFNRMKKRLCQHESVCYCVGTCGGKEDK